MSGQIESVGELRKGHLRTLMSSTWWRVVMLAVPIVVGGLAIVAIPGANPVLAFLVGAAVIALVWTVVTYFIADRRAKASFMAAWANSRGWTVGPGPWEDRATPLLRAGDNRSSDDQVNGPLAGNAGAALCHYTYQVETRDSDGSTSTQDHPFTVVQTAADTEIGRLTLHPRTFGDNRLFDKLDSMLTRDRVVNLESSELEKKFKLEVGDHDSDIVVRLFFEPAFMVWCLDRAAQDLMIEIENGRLVVAVPDHSFDASRLDALVDMASTVAARLADAHAATPQGDPR